MFQILLVFCLIAPQLLYAQTVLCLGDSLTEGYQLDKEEAFPFLLEQKLKEKNILIKVINGGVAGATTASGLKRLDWYLKAKPTHMVLALGANDGLRGLELSETEKNLSAVIEQAQRRGIKILLAGMKMPANYGEPYRGNFEKLFHLLAAKYQIKLLPFLLDGVGGIPKYNLADGIHPNGEGHKIMANNILKYLEPLL